jgi:PKD repeat protein
MTTQFQVTNFPEIYAAPIVDEMRDYQNVYWDNGPPDYLPIDKNKGIDLYRLAVDKSILTVGQEHGFRVRFRDHNLRWSDWSEEIKFTPVASSSAPAADFAASQTNVAPNTKVTFSDLSNATATTWDWDLNGDGTVDSKAQYPEFIYTSNGSYTVKLTINKGIANELSETKNNYIVVNATGIEMLNKEQLKLSVYPNPVQTSTTIGFTLQEKTAVNVSVYDLNGRLVKVLNNGMLSKGMNKLAWDGTSATNQTVPNGQYFIKLSGEHINLSEPIVLNK